MLRAAAYHLLPRVLMPVADDKARLGALFGGLLQGFVNGPAYWQAARGSQGRLAPSVIDSRLRELIASDANPIVPLVLESGSAAVMATRWNALHRGWQLPIDTLLDSDSGGERKLVRHCHAEGVDCELQGRIMASCIGLLDSAVGTGPRAIKPATGLDALVQAQGFERSVVAEGLQLLQDLPDKLPLPRVAQALGCTTRTLQRELQRFGLTWPALRTALRLHRAAAHLRHGTRSLTEIAHDSGFYDSAHFANAFRRSAGVSPSLYRSIARDAPSAHGDPSAPAAPGTAAFSASPAASAS